MHRLIRRTISLLGPVALLLPMTAQAQYPPYGYQPPPHNYQYRPQGPNNARSLPPSYNNAGPYGYGQPAAQTTLRPRLELELLDKRPYVQENTLLTLRVISGSNLSTIDPLLPQNQSLSFHKVKGPTALSRVVSGQRQIVNEIIYMVTPLEEGTIELPISAKVQVAGNGYAGQELTVEASQPLRLESLPAEPGVLPWLPLEQLAITSNMDAPLEVEPGKPVSLVLKLSAAGATGAQLPSLERLLQSQDFRVYREKTETQGGLSRNGRHIMGTRSEHYTLVPQYGGTLRLPSARVTWFNVSSGTVEHSSLPIKTLKASGRSGGLERFFGQAGGEGSMFPAGYTSAFWLPLTGIFLLLTGYWIGVWYKGRSERPDRPSPLAPLAPLKSAVNGALGGAWTRTGRTLRALNPIRYWNRAMARFANMLPTSLRLWFWVRCANDEQDPALWCKTLQFMSCRQLALSPYATLPQMADKVIQCQPTANPQQVKQLFRELDGAIYGHQTIDFEHWKQDFKKQVRPSLLGRGRKQGTGHKEHKLPELNPRAAA